jgi:hypothetical protein
VVVGSVVVGSVLVGVASVVVGAAVVVGAVVVGAVVVGAVVVGAVVVVGVVTGGWVMVAPTVERASVIVAVPAVAGAWALTGPGVVVGLLTASGTVAGVGVERVGAVVGSCGPVVEVDAELVAGSAWAAGSTRAGARRGGGGWGDRVAEATRAARTAVVARRQPALVSRATVTSRGAEGLATSAAEGGTSTWCIVPVGLPFKAYPAHSI